MRRWLLACVLTVSMLSLTTGGGAWATGQINFSFGQNVDPALVQKINDGGSSSVFHLLVFGSGLAQADSATGVSASEQLGAVGAQGVQASAAQTAVLASQPGVQYVTADLPVAPAGTLTPAGAVSAAALATTYPETDDVTGLWSNGITGSGVGIAIVDSGVTPRADFGNRLVQVQLPGQGSSALTDNVGHGSAVAGVAAGESPDGQYIGVAPGATVYAVNVAQPDGVYTSDVIAGLDWVLANAQQDDIRVVNLSLQQTSTSSYLTNTLDAAVELLWNSGITVVCSAGNLGPDSEDYAPANDPFVVTVGASDENGSSNTAGDTLASFSSYGTTPDGFSKPEIVAPGDHIVTSMPAGSIIAQSAPAGYMSTDATTGLSYVRISGTSFAAPQVSGAAALLLQQNPNLSPDEIKWLLMQDERPLAGSNAGALDVGAISAAELANPGSADQGISASTFGQAGEQTASFVNTIVGQPPGHALDHAEAASSLYDALAQVTCVAGHIAAATAGSTVSPVAATNCASRLDTAAADWNNASQVWGNEGSLQNAALDARKAAIDYQKAANAWALAGNSSSNSTDVNNATSAWTNAENWQAAAWDAGAWDTTASSTDEWTAAAWDAAAWDAAAWDAAAWD